MTTPVSPKKELSLLSATAIVAGSMIGSGIFIVSADIARQVSSPSLLLFAWLITTVMTIIGALTYAELAAMMPTAGGQYVYLRESFGPLSGFLYGWTLFLVIQTGTIAAVAMAFAKFLGVFYPSISSTAWLLHFGKVPVVHLFQIPLGGEDLGLSTGNLVAICVLAALTAVNVLGVKLGALLQNTFTVAKVAALFLLIAVGLFAGRDATAIHANWAPAAFWQGFSLHSLFPVTDIEGGIHIVGMFTVLAIVQTGSLFSADAWNNVTFTAGEISNPKRNLPLSLIIGTGTVLSLYLLVNVIYLCVLPLHGSPDGATAFAHGIQYATEDRVATAVLQQIFPAGAIVMTVVILISTFGCANGMILAGARVVQTMSKDGLFFGAAATQHPSFGTPVVALTVQLFWAALLCLSGSYGQLLDYTMFAALLFYILTVASVFVLRIRKPNAARPYRALGYPVLPVVYIVLAAWICVCLLRYKPQFTWPGVFLVALGVPVYFLRRRSSLSYNE
jgi:APA family basic amino acid/polyamine antiporter